jgi:hypothetical protein
MLTKEDNAKRMRLARAVTRESENAEYAAIESRRVGSTREEYAKFLQRYYWDDIITVTFRGPRKEPYYAAKAVWSELSKHCAVRAFIAIEPFQSGDLHLHGIVAGISPPWYPRMSLPWDIWDGLFKRFGRSKVEACNSAEKVTMYCAKYILKQQSRVCDYYYVMGDKWAWENGRLN